ncbi:unnamed protein product [Rhizophagus irregularis]|nr:unnamed protein product [Rhizophagus irregularis]
MVWYRHDQTIPTSDIQLEDEDVELRQCLKEMKRRFGNMGALLADSNEAMHCEYISAILYASLYTIKRITNKELILAPQLEVVGEEKDSEEEKELYKNVKWVMEVIVDASQSHHIHCLKMKNTMNLNSIATKINDQHGTNFNGYQCKEKFANLIRDYNSMCEYMSGSRRARRSRILMDFVLIFGRDLKIHLTESVI